MWLTCLVSRKIVLKWFTISFEVIVIRLEYWNWKHGVCFEVKKIQKMNFPVKNVWVLYVPFLPKSLMRFTCATCQNVWRAVRAIGVFGHVLDALRTKILPFCWNLSVLTEEGRIQILPNTLINEKLLKSRVSKRGRVSA